MVRRVSAESGGKAFKIDIGDEAYVDFENFFFDISSPILKNVKLSFNCEAALSNITTGMRSTFYNDKDNFIVGKQSDRTIELNISGLSTEGHFSKTVIIPPIDPTEVYFQFKLLFVYVYMFY